MNSVKFNDYSLWRLHHKHCVEILPSINDNQSTVYFVLHILRPISNSWHALEFSSQSSIYAIQNSKGSVGGVIITSKAVGNFNKVKYVIRKVINHECMDMTHIWPEKVRSLLNECINKLTVQGLYVWQCQSCKSEKILQNHNIWFLCMTHNVYGYRDEYSLVDVRKD